MAQPNEFTLVKDASGKHYEKMCEPDDAEEVLRTIQQCFRGVLGGHVPESDRRYAGRFYAHRSGKIIIKMTHRVH